MGNARYIGRIGSLAVALGVGAAVLSTPGVAFADESGSGSDSGSSSNSDPAGSSPGPSPSAATADSTPSNTDATPTADVPARSPGALTDRLTDLVRDPSQSIQRSLDALQIVIRDKPDRTPATGTPITGSDPAPTATTIPQSGGRHRAPEPVADLVAAPVQHLSQHLSDAAPRIVTAVTQRAATFAPPQAIPSSAPRALSAPTGVAALNSATALPDTVQSVAGQAPDAVRGVVTSLAAVLLGGPGLVPGPAAPAAPSAGVWALAAAARREFERLQKTFLNRTPVVNDQLVDFVPDLPTDTTGPTAFGAVDPDGDELTYSVPARGTAGGPSKGTVTIDQATGKFVYNPDDDFARTGGEDTFTVTVSDEGASSHLHGLLSLLGIPAHTATATVTVKVTKTTTAPVGGDDSATTDEDEAVTINVLANDTDADGDPLTAAVTTGPANGTAVVTGGVVTYTPNANYTGTDTFTYTVSDGVKSDTATVTVTVTPVDDAPVAVDDTATVTEDSATGVVIDVVANDTDIDGGPKAVASVTQPTTGGTVTQNVDGTLTFVPTADFAGDATFTYTLTGGSTANVTVTVTGVDDPPVAVDDTATVTEDSAGVIIDVLGNDTDIDGGPKTIIDFTQPLTGGTVIKIDDQTFRFVPAPDFNGQTSFTYTVNGGATATVTVNVTAVDDAPVAVDDRVTVDEDSGTVVINVLDNDTDIDGGPKAITSFTQPAAGTGTVFRSFDTLVYTPPPDFNGEATFTYTLDGGTTATVTVTVTPVDDLPIAVDDAVSTAEDTTVTFDVRTNDTDIDGGPKNITAFTPPATGGTLTQNLDGTFTFVPTPDFTGETTFSYLLDGSIGTVTITVTPVDDAPVAVDDAATVTEDDAAGVVIDVLANDTDIDGGPKTVASVTQPTTGGTVTQNADGTLTFTPTADFAGDTTFTYTLNEGSTATVTVTVTGVDDAPAGVDDVVSTNEDTPVTFDVTGNDTDIDGGPKAVASFTQPTTGGTVTQNADGTLTFTPTSDFNGETTFTYTLNGGATATVTVTVEPVDDDPVAVDDEADTTEDDAAGVVIDVLANDTDIDGGPKTVVDFTQPAGGIVTQDADGSLKFVPTKDFTGETTFTYTLNGGAIATVTVTVAPVDDAPVGVDDTATVTEDSATGVVIDVLTNDTDIDGGPKTVTDFTQPATGGTVTKNADDTFTFVPTADFAGETTFTYILNGGSTATVTVTVTGVDDAPVAVDDIVSTNEDTAVTFDVRANDTDIDGGPITVETYTVSSGGSVVKNADGTLTFTPNQDVNGTAVIDYVLNGGSAGRVIVNITPVDDAPVAVQDTATVAEDTASGVLIKVLDNDTDVDGGPKQIATFTQPAAGTGTVAQRPDGFVFTPASNFTGQTTFTYTLNGGSTATVTVTVTPVDDGPVAVNDSASVTEDTATGVLIKVLDNDTDIDGGPKFVQSFTQPAAGTGTVVQRPDGFVFTPASNFAGQTTFTYTLNGGSVGTVTVTVTPVDDTPVAVNDTATVAEDTATGVRIDVLANDTDIDGGPKTVTGIVAQPASNTGTATVNADGTITFVPAANYNGTTEFKYAINGGSVGTVTVTVTPVNDTPVITRVDAISEGNNTWVVTPVATDVDGDSLTRNVVYTGSAPVTVTPLTNGRYRVVANPAWAVGNPGTSIPLTVSVSDGNGGVALQTVTVVTDNVASAGTTLPPLPPGTTYTEAAPGSQGGLFVRSDGTAVGSGIFGNIPALPPGMTYTQAAADVYHGVLIRSDGAAVPILGYFGGGDEGQLNIPALPAGVRYTQADVGILHTVLLRSDGQAVAVGASPQSTVPALPTGRKYTQVAAGWHGSLFLRDDGSVVTSGYNSFGQNNIPAGTYKAIDAGAFHNVLLKTDGTAVAVGDNSMGQLNIPTLPAGMTYTQIAAGENHTVLLRSDGTVVAVGDNSNGQLNIPPAPAGYRYTSIAAGGNGTVATATPINL